MDQKERVKPQKGHGSPVTFKKVHPMRGRDRRGTQNGSTKAEPVSNTNGRCTTITSQYESGLDHTGNNDFPFLGLRCPASMVISGRSGFHRFHAPGIKYFPVCYRQNTNLNGECKNDTNTAGDGADAPDKIAHNGKPKKRPEVALYHVETLNGGRPEIHFSVYNQEKAEHQKCVPYEDNKQGSQLPDAGDESQNQARHKNSDAPNDKKQKTVQKKNQTP